MTSAESTLRYYFSGDENLPFSLGDFDAPVASVLSTRKERLEEWLNGEVVVNGKIEAGVTVTGPVYIGHGASIAANVEITGPVFIGDGCSIRHGAQIRSGSILGNQCVVGHSAEIKNTVAMSGSKLQSGIFAGDSTLGLGARLGSGTILANRRFGQDEVVIGSGEHKTKAGTEFFGAVVGDYARLGANVVSAPGTLVGPYTWVSSLVSLHGFVPRAKLVMLKQELDIRDKDETALRSGRGEYEPG